MYLMSISVIFQMQLYCDYNAYLWEGGLAEGLYSNNEWTPVKHLVLGRCLDTHLR